MASCRLAVVIIARDEARCIARCLNSVAGIADKVVVLDTGSVDDTVAICSALGAEVHRWAWNDNFADARNRALDIADAAWNFCVDADEWLTAGADALRTLTVGAPAHVGQVRVDSLFGVAMAGTTPSTAPSWISRLMPHGVRYAGQVHEQPVHGLPIERTTIVLAHDGYLDAFRAPKNGRNRRLLEQALVVRPDDPYLAYQLGKDHEIAGEFDEASRHYGVALQVPTTDDGYRHDLVVRQIFTLKCLGRHADAVQLAEGEMVRWPASPDFFFALGDLLLDWAAVEPARAPDLLPMAEASWRRCVEIGESDAHEGAVAGRGSWLAAHNLAVVCDGTGRLSEAAEWTAIAEGSRTTARPPSAD